MSFSAAGKDGSGAPSRRAWLALAIAEPMIAAHFALAYVNGTTSWIDVPAYMAGHERVPFQYRILTAWLLRMVMAVPLVPAMARHASQRLAQPEMLAWLLLTCVAAWAALYGARLVAGHLFADRVASRLAGLTFAAVLYLNYEALASGWRLSYPYDVPSVAFFMGAWAALLAGRLVWFALLFALMTLCRETSIFLIPVLLAWFWRAAGAARIGRPIRLLACAMLGYWLLVKGALAWAFAGNPSEAALHHHAGVPGAVMMLRVNIENLLSPLGWPNMLSALCWLWLPVAVCWDRIGDPRIRRVIAWVTPLWVLGMFLVGRITETRVFGELTVIYWTATLSLVAHPPRQKKEVLF